MFFVFFPPPLEPSTPGRLKTCYLNSVLLTNPFGLLSSSGRTDGAGLRRVCSETPLLHRSPLTELSPCAILLFSFFFFFTQNWIASYLTHNHGFISMSSLLTERKSLFTSPRRENICMPAGMTNAIIPLLFLLGALAVHAGKEILCDPFYAFTYSSFFFNQNSETFQLVNILPKNKILTLKVFLH